MSGARRTLTSGEMVRESGLSMKALRLYDAKGLLVPAEVDPRTGYRSYTPEQVDRARQIALLRRLEIPLAQVTQVLDADPARARELLLAWWLERSEGLAEQREAALELARSLGAVPDHVASDPALAGQVRRRASPERTMAAITSQVSQADLVPTFTADALAIRRYLADVGAEAAPGHGVIFHEPPVAELPGRVETCVSYTGAVAPAGSIVLRAEPARTEAYLEVPVRDCGFPRIVGYHATLRDLAPGPTRELYRGSWSEDPAEVVAEVVIEVD